MINTPLPDKWVRKAIFDACNGMTVDGDTIPVFDMRVTQEPEPEKYILIRVQNNGSERASFCGYRWTHRVNIEAFTRTPANLNPGTRVAVDNIVDNILTALQGLGLDAGSGLTIKSSNFSTLGDFYEIDNGYAVAAKTVLLELEIN